MGKLFGVGEILGEIKKDCILSICNYSGSIFKYNVFLSLTSWSSILLKSISNDSLFLSFSNDLSILKLICLISGR